MNPTLLSDDAKGANTIFKKLAKKNGHNTLIYKASDIDPSTYKNYDEYLKYLNNNYLNDHRSSPSAVGATANRKYPTQNEYVNNLLRRDVKVGLEADVLYAITWLDEKESSFIHGGTAWSCYTFIDKHIRKGEELIPAYIFDQIVKKWYQIQYDKSSNNIKFEVINFPPKINGLDGIKYAGIGTREINDDGIKEIEKLYE